MHDLALVDFKDSDLTCCSVRHRLKIQHVNARNAGLYRQIFIMIPTKFAFITLITISCAACSTIAQKTNMLSDADLISKSADALGVSAGSLTLLDRHTDGTDTYADFRATNGIQYRCMINGGNLLSLGMTNPASCSKAGTPLAPVSPFSAAPSTAVPAQAIAAAPNPSRVAAPLSLRAAQDRLNALGFDAGVADGRMGPRTRHALLAFQRSRGIALTGTLDAQTAAALEIGR